MREVFVLETLAMRLQKASPSPFRGTRWGYDKLDHEEVVRDVGAQIRLTYFDDLLSDDSRGLRDKHSKCLWFRFVGGLGARAKSPDEIVSVEMTGEQTECSLVEHHIWLAS
jgi:hypothetical protein